jgi:hypothetical protein
MYPQVFLRNRILEKSLITPNKGHILAHLSKRQQEPWHRSAPEGAFTSPLAPDGSLTFVNRLEVSSIRC